MKIYPAIDIKGGKCVRLKQGRMADETVYAFDPIQVAARWEASGASIIHIVDLDGAVRGVSISFNIIKNIIYALKIPVQVGGGIRDRRCAEKYLELGGIKRIILGTVAYENPELVKSLSREFPGRIAVGIDAKNGKVATKGWLTVTDKSAVELAKGFEDAGVGAIIYTDISRDGMMSGPNIDATMEIANCVDIPVIASGGVSGLGDIDAYARAQEDSGVDLDGVIIGKALYSTAIDLKQAVVRARVLGEERLERQRQAQERRERGEVAQEIVVEEASSDEVTEDRPAKFERDF